MTKLLLSALTVLSCSAFAAEGTAAGSEFFHQAPMGISELTPGLRYTSMSLDTGTESTDKGFTIGVLYEYGLNDMISLGAQLEYMMNKLDPGDTDHTGLSDLMLKLKGTYPMTGSLFRYGADLAISLGDDETKANGDQNNFSGGYTLTPYVGYEMGVSTGVWGARLKRDLLLGERSVKVGATSGKRTAGEETGLSAFYEHNLTGAQLGVALSFNWTDSAKVKGGGSFEEAPSPLWNLDVYLPVDMGGGTLIPKVMYGGTTDKSLNGTDIDSASMWSIGVDYRIAM